MIPAASVADWSLLAINTEFVPRKKGDKGTAHNPISGFARLMRQAHIKALESVFKKNCLLLLVYLILELTVRERRRAKEGRPLPHAVIYD